MQCGVHSENGGNCVNTSTGLWGLTSVKQNGSGVLDIWATQGNLEV
jgi:hypothetical protein